MLYPRATRGRQYAARVDRRLTSVFSADQHSVHQKNQERRDRSHRSYNNRLQRHKL